MQKGRHLIVEGKGVSCICESELFLSNFVTSLIEKIGMTCLRVCSVEVETDIKKLGREPFEDEGGVSVAAILSTSHITIHTWPLRKEFQMDIYSCRDFEVESVIEFVEKELGTESFEIETWRR